ncbi:nucleotide repair protein isoform X1 [Wolffia australiana]
MAGKKSVLRIPAYDKGGEAGDRENASSSSAATVTRAGESSFTQAFSFIKSSEFYSPPPLPDASQVAEDGGDRTPQSSRPVDGVSSSSTASASTALNGQNRNAILVSHRQKGNPLLKHIRNVRWIFADVVCDYLLGQSSCALYISLRYHLLHPDYLYYRIRELQKNFKLCVVLCHVDVVDVAKPLLEVTRTALLHDCTLLCGWSLEECGRYLETIKVYENKSADSIREQMDTDYLSRLTHALTSIRHVNKTDVITLGSTFGSLSGIIDSSMEDLARCPGIGEQKVRRLHDTFHKPFRRVYSELTPLSKCSAPENSARDSSEEVIGDENPTNADCTADPSKDGKKADLSVKSALSSAFAKYSSKIRGRDRKDRSLDVPAENNTE